MSKELAKQTNQESNLPALPGLPTYSSMDHFAAVLSSAPDPKMVGQTVTESGKVLKGGAVSLAISSVEAQLDSIFGVGCWDTQNFRMEIIGSSTEKAGQAYYVAYLTLGFLHPITRQWRSHEGTASGYVEHKTMETFAQAAMARCMKNAAKKLGEVFGRNLNRKEDKISDILDEQTMQHLHNEGIMDEIQNADSMEALKFIRANLTPALRQNKVIRQALNQRADEIEKGGSRA